MSDLREVLQENSYLRQKQLIFADCDRYQRARVSTLLSIAAAVAGADYDARGLTYEKLYEMREVFLLSRIALRIHRCPRALQVVDVTTWEDGVKAAHMQRVYEITDREGLLVSIRSDWILVDPQTRRIMRPGTFTAKKLGTCPKVIDAPEPRKILLPREGLRIWALGRWSGPTWTVTAMCTAATTVTSSGTTCPPTCRKRCPGSSSSITARKPPWARSCGWWAAARAASI